MKDKLLKSLKCTNILIALAILLLLSGCGFHFVKNPPDSTPIKIQLQTNNPSSIFTEILISKMKEREITLQDKKTSSTKFFALVGPIKEEQSIIDLSGNALAGTYTETYNINITIIDLQPQSSNIKNNIENNTKTYTLSSTGSFSSNSTQMLSQNTQKEQIKKAAYKDLADKIINQLNIIIQEQVKNQPNQLITK